MRFLQLHRTYAACLLAALALGASCTKTVYDDGQRTESPAISLSVSEGAMTRALVDNSNFGKTYGNRIQVYDFWTDGATASKYIDAYAGPKVESPSSQHVAGTTWPFVNKSTGKLERYNWTSTGEHKFFGWFAVDASENMTAGSFFGPGFSFDESSKVLTIPAKTLNQSTPQFDFLYSDINKVDVSKSIPNYVPMSFSHLFAAISFGAKNTTASEVKLLEFKVENLHNSNSATINFNVDAPADSPNKYAPEVSYGTATVGSSPALSVNNSSSDVILQQNGTMNNIFGKPGDPQQFFLMWPHSNEQLYSSGSVTEDTDGNPIYPASYKMYVKYTVGGVEFTKRLNFPKKTDTDSADWKPGFKYHYDIIFADKMVELKCVVNPWNYIQQNIDFKDQAVTVKEGFELKWDTTVSDVDSENTRVAIMDNKPAEGNFTIDTPEGGRWFAYLTGDIDAFKIIDGEGPVGTAGCIKVQPIIDSPERDYVVKVHFIVRTADGKTLDADSVLQPKVYSIILPKNK